MNKLAARLLYMTASCMLAPTSAAHAQQPASCSGLAAITLPHTKILQAVQVDPGAPKTLPAEADIAEIAKAVPPFCRVVAQLTPSADSDIRVELWLPAQWNGSFRGQGNGGFAGNIDHAALGRAVALGYASAATDAGHTGSATDAAWALHHPEKIADFGYRAIHEMTTFAKSLLQTFYGSPAKHSFFAACSDGGREALMEAQRFPTDYDGILAGAPAYNWTSLMTGAIVGARTLTATPASYIPAAKLPAISAAVLAACDAQDGLRDGIVNDPRTCHVPPRALLCRRGDQASCLTRAQLKAFQTLFNGVHAADGSLIQPGYLPGSELGPNGWASWVTGKSIGESAMSSYGTGFFRNMVYSDPAWSLQSFTIDDAYRDAQRTSAAALNATDTNLAPFFSRGGKLILYHGWNDPAIPALGTIDYFTRMTAATPAADDSARLYMVPGMQHCAGGPGATLFGQFGWSSTLGPDNPQHDLSLALEQWVERGIAPKTIVAAKYDGPPKPENLKLSRPICPYPQIARYNGAGDPDSATSFTCKASR